MYSFVSASSANEKRYSSGVCSTLEDASTLSASSHHAATRGVSSVSVIGRLAAEAVIAAAFASINMHNKSEIVFLYILSPAF